MKTTIDISKILAKKQIQKEQNYINNIKFEYSIRNIKEYKPQSQKNSNEQKNSNIQQNSNEQNGLVFLSCVLQQYNKYNKLFYQSLFGTQPGNNVLNVADYVYLEQYRLEKKPLPTSQIITVIFFPILPEVEKIIVKEERFKDVSLQYEQSQVMNETVYTQKVLQPQYINSLIECKNENIQGDTTHTAYTLTEMLTQFQKLIIKLLENRNKLIIYTGEDFKKYVQNILYQLE